MTTRAQRDSYINGLTLSDAQKNKFRRSTLNRNTIQKVVNALKGRGERNVRINGILNALSSGNRVPLNTLLRQYNNRNAPQTTQPTRNQNTQPSRNVTPQTYTRARRDGAGFSENVLMAPGELYEFFQLMKEYQEKRGKVTRKTASPMPILKEM